MRWQLESIELPLRFTWAISRGSTDKKISHIITVRDGEFEGRGECSGITRSMNDLASEPQEIFAAIDFTQLSDLKDVRKLSNIPNSMKFAIESAWIELLAKKSRQTVSDFLGIKNTNSLTTSYAIPLRSPKEIEPFFIENNLERFSVIKLKTGYDDAIECCLSLGQIYSGPVRVDANEAFQSAAQVLNFIESVSAKVRLEFLEQPLPAHAVTEYLELRKKSPVPIVADESLQDSPVDQKIVDQFHGINVKMMKAGGYFTALEQLQSAREMNIKTMLGCMLETTIGISSAMNIAADVDWFDLDGFLFMKSEPFGLVKEDGGRLYRKVT